MFPTNPSNRLTYPTGTKIPDPFSNQYNPFSNPSTAANGALGAGAGANNLQAPQIGAQVGTPQAAQGTNSFGDWLKNLFKVNPPKGQVYVPPGIGNPQNNPAQPKPLPFYRNPDTGFANIPSNSKPTNAFATQNTPSSSPSPMVGNDIGSSPNSVDQATISQMFQGYSQDQINQSMANLGYSYNPPSPANDYQGSWLKTGVPAQAQQGGVMDKYGAYFDPGSLNRYEKVKGANGNIYRGGQAVTKDLSASTPAGTGQYSVTLQQNINKKLEAHGAYKWTSTLSRDANGNWVRTYKKVLKGYKTRAGRQRMENNAANQQQPDANMNQNFNSLVTLRANYG